MQGATEEEIYAVAEEVTQVFSGDDVLARRECYDKLSERSTLLVGGMAYQELMDRILASGMMAGIDASISPSDYFMSLTAMDSAKAALQKQRCRLYFSMVSRCNGHLVKAMCMEQAGLGKMADYIDLNKCTVDDIVDFETNKAMIARWETLQGKRKGRPKSRLMDNFDEGLFASIAKEVYRQKYQCDIMEDNARTAEKGDERSNCFLISFASASVGGAHVISAHDAVKNVYSFVTRVFSTLQNLWSLRRWQLFFARFKEVEIASANHFSKKLGAGIMALIDELTGLFSERAYCFVRLNNG